MLFWLRIFHIKWSIFKYVLIYVTISVLPLTWLVQCLCLFFKEMPWATFVWFDLEDFTVVVTQSGTSLSQSIIFVCIIITARLTCMSYFEFFSVTVTRLEGFFRVSYDNVAHRTPNSWEISRFYQCHVTRTYATFGFPAKCRLRNESRNSILMTSVSLPRWSGYCLWLVGPRGKLALINQKRYPDLGMQWHFICMEFLLLFLKRLFAGKPVSVASRNVVY